MAKWIRNEYYKKLTYENLFKAHMLARKGKNYRDEIIKFNLKQEEYIMYLYEQLKNKTYKHGGYKIFYVTEPKLRKIERSRYIDRIVHTFYVENFLKPYFTTQFINTSYACIKNKGMHKACLELQQMMKHCKRIWNEYYILKMDVAKFFQNIDKDILMEILLKKIKDKDLIWLTQEIIYSNNGKKNLPIRKLYITDFCKYIFEWSRSIYKTSIKNKILFKISPDDSVILVKTKEEAKNALEKIRKFLKANLDLELNNKTQIFKSKQGVNYCGYKINEYRLKIRDKGKRKLKKKIKSLKYEIKQGNITSKEAHKYLSGHLGYIEIANVKSLTDKLFYNDK